MATYQQDPPLKFPSMEIKQRRLAKEQVAQQKQRARRSPKLPTKGDSNLTK